MALGLKKYIIRFGSAHLPAFSYLLLLGGLVVTILLPVCFSRGTYFSENSLLAGRGVQTDRNMHKAGFMAKQLETAWVQGRDEWIARLRKAASSSPYLLVTELDNVITLTMPSRRGWGSAVILSAPCHHHLTVSMLVLYLLDLDKEGWSNMDTVTVLSCEGSHLAEYLDRVQEPLPSAPYLNKGGIRAGIHLDIDAYDFKSVKIETVGPNGMQPNMDLVNVASQMCRSSGVECSVLRKRVRVPPHVRHLANAAVSLQLPNLRAANSEDLALNIVNFWHYASTLVLDPSNGTAGHSGMRGAGVHAFTLRPATKLKPPIKDYHKYMHMQQVLNVVDGTLRALNNLCERLHQSFWIYIYTNDGHFVDYDNLQMQCWLLVAAIITSAFTVRRDDISLLNAVTGAAMAFAPCVAAWGAGAPPVLFGVLCMAATSVLQILFGSPSTACGGKIVVALVASSILAGFTVLDTALGLFGSVVVAIPMVLGQRTPWRITTLLSAFLLVALSPLSALAWSGRTDLPTKLLSFYYLVALPSSSSALSVLLVVR